MSQHRIEDSKIRELERRLHELRPLEEEELANDILAELRKTSPISASKPQWFFHNERFQSVRGGLVGFLLGAGAMFLLMLGLFEHFPKVQIRIVEREIVREVPSERISPIASEEKTQENFETPFPEDFEKEKPGNFQPRMNMLDLLGLAVSEPVPPHDLDAVLLRQRDFSRRSRPESPKFALQSLRPLRDRSPGSLAEYREILEKVSEL